MKAKNDPRTGNEIACFLGGGFLRSVRDDGSVWGLMPGMHAWARIAKRRDDVPLDEWINSKREALNEMPAWRKKTKIPTLRQLEKWAGDGVCLTPSGHRVEPDGVGPDGSPSWLLFFGYI